MLLILQSPIRQEIPCHGGEVKINVARRGGGEPVTTQGGVLYSRAPKVRAVEVGVGNIGSDKAGTAGFSLHETSKINGGSIKLASPKLRPVQIGFLDQGSAKINVVCHRVPQQGPVERRTHQRRRGEPDSLHTGLARFAALRSAPDSWAP